MAARDLSKWIKANDFAEAINPYLNRGVSGGGPLYRGTLLNGYAVRKKGLEVVRRLHQKKWVNLTTAECILIRYDLLELLDEIRL